MKKLLSVFLASIFLLSCKGNGDTPGPLSATTVYMAGLEFQNGISLAKVWKNGVASYLTDGKSQAAAVSISVSGDDVYVAGWEQSGQSGFDGRLWKNGVDIALPNCNGAQAVTVAGNDSYTAAYANYRGTYYKNGTTVSVSNFLISPTGIAISGSDVIISGTSQPVGGELRAGYWKNNATTLLSTRYSQGNSVAVSGSDIYVAGFELNDDETESFATYWKNGIAVHLTDGTSNAYLTGIAVEGSDVYVSGNTDDDAVYWKNGVKTIIRSGNGKTTTTAIAVKNGDVFVAGAAGTTIKCWKNGVDLNDTDNTQSAIYSIVVR